MYDLPLSDIFAEFFGKMCTLSGAAGGFAENIIFRVA